MKTRPISAAHTVLVGVLSFCGCAGQNTGSPPLLPGANANQPTQEPTKDKEATADAKVTFLVKGMKKTKSGAT